MIYFVQGERSGMVKIGYSENVNRRVSALRVASPERLRCIAIINGAREDEERLHRRFAAERSHGEWFHPRDSLFRFLEKTEHKQAPTNHALSRVEGRRRRRDQAVTRERCDAVQRAADAAGLTPRDFVVSRILKDIGGATA